MNKLIAIVGPTASGKSDLAVEIAQHVDGEVVSADSRQVYRGLDIGSGKITTEEMHGVPHHMINVADPHETYSALQYQQEARQVLGNIWHRGNIPILCGGTGQYIEAVVDNPSFPEVPPNPHLRKELESLPLTELQERLERADPRRFSSIDTANKVRLVRALEIVDALGAVPPLKKRGVECQTLLIGIHTEKDTLHERIHARIQARIASGMIDEVQQLHDNAGVSWQRLEALGLEYRYIAQFLQGKITKEIMLETLETEIRKYAKRQMTWFKRDDRINWFKLKDKEKILRRAQDFVGLG